MPHRTRRSPLKFFALVIGLSVPFWLLGVATDVQLMPGLSVSVLMAFCPAAAALILVHRENKAEGITALLRRSLDFRRITARRWYVPILLLMPSISIVAYGLMRWVGMPLPAPQISVLPTMLMSVAFFAGAVGEDWDGQATRSNRCWIAGAHCGRASRLASSRLSGTSCR